MRSVNININDVPEEQLPAEDAVEEIVVNCICGRESTFGIRVSSMPDEIPCTNPECNVKFTKAMLGYANP